MRRTIYRSNSTRTNAKLVDAVKTGRTRVTLRARGTTSAESFGNQVFNFEQLYLFRVGNMPSNVLRQGPVWDWLLFKGSLPAAGLFRAATHSRNPQLTEDAKTRHSPLTANRPHAL